jgi:hypothetical protein
LQILRLAGSPAAVADLQSLPTGVPFHGNRLVASEIVSLNPSPDTAARRSLLTTLLQWPWRVLFARLAAAERG